MKKLFILMCVVLFLSQATPFDDDLDNFDRVSDSEVRNTNIINSLARYGVRLVLDKVEADSEIFKANDFELEEIQDVWRRRDPKVRYYKYSVRIDNKENNDLYIQSNFAIQYVPSTNARSLVYYDYAFNLDESRSELRDYETIPRRRYDEDLIQRLLKYGVDQVLLKARGQGQVPNKRFSIDDVNRIQRRRDDDIVYYKFDVELDEQNGRGEIQTTFIVMYLRDSGDKEVVDADYSYDKDGRNHPPKEPEPNHDDNSDDSDDDRPDGPRRDEPNQPTPKPNNDDNKKDDNDGPKNRP